MDFMEQETEFIELVIFDPVIYGLSVPATIQNVAVFHKTEMLGCVLEGGLDSEGDLGNRQLFPCQRPQDQDPVCVAKDAAKIRSFFSAFLEIIFHEFEPCVSQPGQYSATGLIKFCIYYRTVIPS